MTKEQQRAIALAKARQRMARAQAKPSGPADPTPLARQVAALPPQAAAAQRQEIARRMAYQAFGAPPSEPLFQTLAPGAQRADSATDFTAPDLPLDTAFYPDFGVSAAGAALTKRIPRTVKGKAWDWLDDVVEPYQNIRQRRVKENKVTPKDWKGSYQFPLDPGQEDMKDVLKTVKGMAGARFGNARDHKNLVIAEIAESGKNLQSKLAHAGVTFSQQETRTKLRKSFKDLLDDPRYARFRDADTEAAIDLAMEVVGNYSVNGKMTADKLWLARREIDSIFQDFAGPRRYALSMGSTDPAVLVPTREEVFWKTSRQAIHGLMESKVPGTREQLKRMNILYSAKDMLIDKIASQDVPTTLVGRAAEKFRRTRAKRWRPIAR